MIHSVHRLLVGAGVAGSAGRQAAQHLRQVARQDRDGLVLDRAALILINMRIGATEGGSKSLEASERRPGVVLCFFCLGSFPLGKP
jgi:hypothetical protein